MDLDLDSTQTLLRDTVREYLEAEVPFDRIRALEREQGWDAVLWKGVCDQGWLGLPFSEEVGGGGGTLVDAGILVEEFARRAAVVPLMEVLACGLALQQTGGAGDTRRLVSALLEGSAVPVPAFLESEDRFDEIALAPDPQGRLRGEKHFVDYAPAATHHLVAARSDSQPGLHLVEARDPAVVLRPLHAIGRTPSALVRYEGVTSQRVGDARATQRLLLVARALAAVQCLGCAQQALDMTVRYAGLREQFGRSIGSFQAVKHHCANMASRVASTRFLAFEALHALERGTATPAQVALAKASASRTVPEVTLLAHQIHGGNGVIEENDLYFFTLRGKERSLAWGTVEECLEVAARGVEDPREWLC
jgi:alkylation response protein AidB-like acyl-CoA dehydrogenase